MVFASMHRPFTAVSPLAANSLAWCSNLSLRSKCTPNHFVAIWGVIVLVMPSLS